MNFHPNKRPPLEINLTPMIDVVFLLLIFFMVTTTFTRETGLNLNLPEAKGDAMMTNRQAITLLIDVRGHYFISTPKVVKGQHIDLKTTTLKNALIKEMAGKPETPFIISADNKTPHQFVIKALDIASQAGFKHIAFSTKAPKSEK
jgi:biopolymer transport protein ExbD